MKKRSIFWTIMQLFPFLVIALFFVARIGQGTEQFQTLNDFILQMKNFTDNFRWADLSSKIEQFLYSYCNMNPDGRRILSNLVSYEVVIMLLRIAYEVIVFLPKFCISAFESKKGD